MATVGAVPPVQAPTAGPVTFAPASEAVHPGPTADRSPLDSLLSGVRKTFGFVKFDNCQSIVKLRTAFKVRNGVSLELGANCQTSDSTCIPKPTLVLEVPEERIPQLVRGRVLKHAAIKLGDNSASLLGRWEAGSKDYGLALKTTALVEYSSGARLLDVGVDDCRPMSLAAAAAFAFLIVTRKPLGVAKDVGGLELTIPFTPLLKVEGNLKLQRRGNGLMLSINQVNPVMIWNRQNFSPFGPDIKS